MEALEYISKWEPVEMSVAFAQAQPLCNILDDLLWCPCLQRNVGLRLGILSYAASFESERKSVEDLRYDVRE